MQWEQLMSLLLLICRICLQFTDLVAGAEYFVPENVTHCQWYKREWRTRNAYSILFTKCAWISI